MINSPHSLNVDSVMKYVISFDVSNHLFRKYTYNILYLSTQLDGETR